MTTALPLNGLFRGICVDNRDPRNLGRIRVQVPQILGTATSGWAFPAWAIHSTTVWPQDRLPSPGDGVWVMFDSTSPDKMIWMAAFGALDLINQPGYVEDVDYLTTVTLSAVDTPTWNQVCTFEGVLDSDSGGVPNPNPIVQLAERLAGGNWKVVGTDTPDPITGAWSIDHLVELTGNVQYRAVFGGVGSYGSSNSEVLDFTVSAVTFPTTLSMSMTDPAPALNKASTFEGVLAASSAPVGYKVPAGATVTLKARSSGSWFTVVSSIPVDPDTGAWSTSYTISVAGSVDYQAVFTATGIYLGSSSAIVPVNTSVNTVVSTPSLPTLYNGTGFSITGTVKTSSGASVTSGTIELWWRYLVGADVTWKKSVTSSVSGSGTYSMTQPALSVIGSTQWQVRYVGTTQYNASISDSVSATVNLRGNGSLTKGAVAHSSAAFSWAAVAGATHYDVQRSVNGGAWADIYTRTTALSVTNSGLSTDTTYAYRVRPAKQDPAGTWIYGAYSSTITMSTGHPQQTDSGSTGWINVTVQKIDSHRIDQGWGYPTAPRFYQGYFSSSYGGEGYIGIAKYTGTRVRDAIIAACGGGTLGSTRQGNGSCTAAEISLKRDNASGSGAGSGPVNIGFTTTTSDGTGGRPTRDGSTVSVDSTSANASSYSWHDIGTAHGQRIGDAKANSISIYRNSSANYANFNVGDLRLKWSWNYTSVAYVAPSWS